MSCIIGVWLATLLVSVSGIFKLMGTLPTRGKDLYFAAELKGYERQTGMGAGQYFF